MKKIKCLRDIQSLEQAHTVPQELITELYQDLAGLYDWAEDDHAVTLEEFHADDYDYGYIALLDGTESAKDLEDEIGLTGGYENTVPESTEIYHWGTDKWVRVIVIYNDSYSMVLWIKNYDGFDSYEASHNESNHYDAAQAAQAPPF